MSHFDTFWVGRVRLRILADQLVRDGMHDAATAVEDEQSSDVAADQEHQAVDHVKLSRWQSMMAVHTYYHQTYSCTDTTNLLSLYIANTDF